MAGCIVRQLLFCTFVYTCYTSHYNKRLLTYLLSLVPSPRYAGKLLKGDNQSIYQFNKYQPFKKALVV